MVMETFSRRAIPVSGGCGDCLGERCREVDVNTGGSVRDACYTTSSGYVYDAWSSQTTDKTSIGMVALSCLAENSCLFFLSPFTPDNLVWRDICSVVPSCISVRSFFTLKLNLVLTHGLLSFVSLYRRPPSGVSPELTESCICVPMAFNANSPPVEGH